MVRPEGHRQQLHQLPAQCIRQRDSCQAIRIPPLRLGDCQHGAGRRHAEGRGIPEDLRRAGPSTHRRGEGKTNGRQPVNAIRPNMLNALTIDVEDYYMVSAFADRIKFEDWCTYECRVERNTQAILDMLDQYGVKATFFVLGWVAERYPELIRNIHRAGHEIASHGYN